MSNLVHPTNDRAVHPAIAFGRSRLRTLGRRVAAGADLLIATQRMDFARMMICWADLRRG